MSPSEHAERHTFRLSGRVSVEITARLGVDFVNVPPPASIAGWRDHNGFQCQRRHKESDEDLAERA
jgi:hypothetical protein